MNRTHLRDLEQSRTLCNREASLELQRPLDTIKSSRLRLAFRAVCGVNPGVLKSDGHFLQRSLLSSRVQRDRHGRSTAQRSQQEIVRRGTGIGAAVRNRFVCRETMVTRRDRLRESLCDAPNGHSRFVRCVVNGHVRQSHREKRNQLAGFGRAKWTRLGAVNRGPLYATTSPKRVWPSQSARACAISS